MLLVQLLSKCWLELVPQYLQCLVPPFIKLCKQAYLMPQIQVLVVSFHTAYMNRLSALLLLAIMLYGLVDPSATWHGNVHFWGYFREYTTKIASTHKTPIVALRDILTEIILFAGGIIVRCSPKPASGPEVGLWRPSCTRAIQGMCGVIPTPPHTFACVPGLVPAQPRTILMRGTQGAPTSQPQQLDLASRRANAHVVWITAK